MVIEVSADCLKLGQLSLVLILGQFCLTLHCQVWGLCVGHVIPGSLVCLTCSSSLCEGQMLCCFPLCWKWIPVYWAP